MPQLAATDRQRLQQLRKLGVQMDHFFDVGASNGVWSNQVSQDFPHATFQLFEPLVDLVPEYQEKLWDRLSSHPKFRLHKFALGPECGRAPFFLYPEAANSTALPIVAAPPEAKRIEVEMVTLDYVVEEFRLPVPQVIKIDTQGCELSVLRGGTRVLPQVHLLLLECWLTRAYGSGTPLLVEVSQWLRDRGFFLWDVGNGWRNSQGTLVAQDCLFLNARCKASELAQEISGAPHAKAHPGAKSVKEPGDPGRHDRAPVKEAYPWHQTALNAG